MALLKLLAVCLVAAVNLQEIYGHGRMMDPVNRSSAWRKGFPVPPNYTDNEHFCGGVGIQFGKNKGKCGECGDDWSIPRPRPNENGGIFGTGEIVRKYTEGSKINIEVELTANHWGTFEFSLCPLRRSDELETDACFNRYPLKLANGMDKYYIQDQKQRKFVIPVQLPKGVTCKQCVIRWHYRVANSWGICEDGSSGQGCGNQETFRSCADVTIV